MIKHSRSACKILEPGTECPRLTWFAGARITTCLNHPFYSPRTEESPHVIWDCRTAQSSGLLAFHPQKKTHVYDPFEPPWLRLSVGGVQSNSSCKTTFHKRRWAVLSVYLTSLVLLFHLNSWRNNCPGGKSFMAFALVKRKAFYDNWNSPNKGCDKGECTTYAQPGGLKNIY